MTLIVDNSAIKRIHELRTTKDQPGLLLRITVEGGGCSGFQYIMELTESAGSKDLRFADCVVTDDISLPFLEGATIKFKDDLIGSEFIIDNPNAASGCGCGSSFSV
ncbi:MAG: iron-sulfur cluster assembly accessory protein [Rhodospirillales bacterium]|nr:iron-sulfur cluster assembly accessory protein [Alphaproteobacteria bacterium]MCB9981077.1 iron-sulfur cluster assembly accessory protein [Rhodospirillales bacterium]